MDSQESTGSANQGAFGKKLYVRYMLSLRCKMIVKTELEKLGLKHVISAQGSIELLEELRSDQRVQLNNGLRNSGMELLGSGESLIIDKIINTIVEFIHYSDALPKVSFKDIIHENLGSGSESVMKIFSEVKGVSITQFIINEKIDRAKELLLYEDLTPAEISKKLNYRNENYFISQFIKYTDLHPRYFVELKNKRMKLSQSSAVA